MIPVQREPRLSVEETGRLFDAWESYLGALRAAVSAGDYASVQPPIELQELDKPIALECGDRAAGLLADLAVLEHELVVLLAQRHASRAYAAAVSSPGSVFHAVA